MSSVGALQAYAVSIAPLSRHPHTDLIQTNTIAVQRVFYNQRPTFACQFYFFCLASSIHISDWFLVVKNRSVAAYHVDPADWLLNWRSVQVDPRSSAVNDLPQ